MEIQSHQAREAFQVIAGYCGDVVEGQVQPQSLVRYRGDMAEPTVGAVTGELKVAALAWRPVTACD